MTKKASFLNQTLTYGLGLVLNFGVGFILLPVYSRLMPPSDYGILEMLNRTIEFVSILLLSQFGITYLRFYRDKPEEDYRKSVTSTCMILMAVVAGIITVGLLAAREGLSDLIFQSPKYGRYFGLASVRYFAATVTTVPFLYFQATEQPLKYIIFSFTNFATTLVLNIILLYTMNDKIEAVLLAPIMTNAALLLTVGMSVFIRSARKVDWDIARQIVKYTWSFTFLGAYGFIMVYGDRYFLNKYSGDAQVGLYSAAYKVAMVLSTFIFSPIVRVWYAKMIDILGQKDGTKQLARLTSYAFLIYAFAGLIFSVYSRELVMVVMDRRYFECYRVIPIIVVAYGFSGVQNFMDTGLYYTKKTYLKIWLGTTTAMCVLLYFLLIPKYAMAGAAWATLITYLGFVTLTWIINQRVYPIKYELMKLVKILAVGVGVYLINMVLEEIEYAHHMGVRVAALLSYPILYLMFVILVKSLLIVLFAGVILALGVVEPDDNRRIRDIYEKLRSKLGFRGEEKMPFRPEEAIS